MKLRKGTNKLWKFILILGVLSIPSRTQAAGFAYESKDLLFCLRQEGGTSELVVNLGQITNYLNLSAGTLSITNLSANQLNAAFANLNNLRWSVFTCVRSNDEAFPIQTLWVSRPRASREVQSSPWSRNLALVQGNGASKMDSIGRNAGIYGSQQPAGPNNTDVGLVIPTGHTLSYGVLIGSGNFGGSFQGIVEQTTPANFSTAGDGVRSDFYELRPGSGPGTYLGYFEFRPAGELRLVTGSAPTIPRPTIAGFARSGGTNFFSFDTISTASYSVLFTNSSGLGAALTSWPAAGPAIAGTGQIVTYSDPVADEDRFYVIRAN